MGGFSIIVLMGMLVPIFLIYILIRVGITVAVIGISILYPVATIGLLIAAIVYFIISNLFCNIFFIGILILILVYERGKIWLLTT